jgi:AraC-like DNA-binding protein
MVIHDPNVMSITLDPFEDHSPLIIDSDRVKLLEIALELFQTIRWRYGQILQAACRVEGFELTLRHSGDARELTYPLIPEERPSGLVPERSDHQSAVLPHTGIRSTFVSRALSLLHGRMAGQWTVDDLGREVGLSRSALADRFTRLIGEPPMRYLARWRIQVAAHQLRKSDTPLARIAEQVGYESEAAFNRAFKRAFGVPPATWRKSTSGSEVAHHRAK